MLKFSLIFHNEPLISQKEPRLFDSTLSKLLLESIQIFIQYNVHWISTFLVLSNLVSTLLYSRHFYSLFSGHRNAVVIIKTFPHSNDQIIYDYCILACRYFVLYFLRTINRFAIKFLEKIGRNCYETLEQQAYDGGFHWIWNLGIEPMNLIIKLVLKLYYENYLLLFFHTVSNFEYINVKIIRAWMNNNFFLNCSK